MQSLFDGGYSATDIITTLFRVVRNADLHEFVKLEFIKVRTTGALRGCRAARSQSSASDVRDWCVHPCRAAE